MLEPALHEALRLAAFLPRSRANGPGVRSVVWAQGCGRRCPGCANPQMQDPAGGSEVTVAEVWGWVQEAAPDGLTVTGGEPFDQPCALAELGRLAHEHGLTLVCFTGCTLEELRAEGDPARLALLDQTDLLIDGPYDQDQPCSEPLRSCAGPRL